MPFHLALQYYPIKMKPLISIIITCYNYGRYLAQSLDSAMNQTYPNVEVLIVDDGSPDLESQRFLEEIEKKYPNVPIYRKTNSGQSGARNFGIGKSNANYFIQLDADDYIAPTYAEECMKQMIVSPQISPVYTDVTFFGDEDFTDQVPEWNLEKIKRANFIYSCPAFNRKAWEACGGYDVNMFGDEDYELYLHMALKGFIGKRIPGYLLFKRYHLSEMVCVGSVLKAQDPKDNMTKYVRFKHKLKFKPKLMYCLGLWQTELNRIIQVTKKLDNRHRV